MSPGAIAYIPPPAIIATAGPTIQVVAPPHASTPVQIYPVVAPGAIIGYHISIAIPSNPSPNEFLSPDQNNFTTVEASTQVLMPRSGTLKNLTVLPGTSSARTAPTTVTVRKNGADTLLAVSIPAGSVAVVINAVDTVSFIAGVDKLSVRLDTNAGSGGLAGGFSCTMEYA